MNKELSAAIEWAKNQAPNHYARYLVDAFHSISTENQEQKKQIEKLKCGSFFLDTQHCDKLEQELSIAKGRLEESQKEIEKYKTRYDIERLYHLRPHIERAEKAEALNKSLAERVAVMEAALTAAETALVVHSPERTDCVLGIIRRAKSSPGSAHIEKGGK